MGEPVLRTYTWSEYLAEDAASDVRLEYIDGFIVAMAGGTPTHGLLAMTVGRHLGNALDGRPCGIFSSDVRVRVLETGRATYPDLTVVCGDLQTDPDDANSVINPALLVEVLSESTELSDRTEKWFHYQRLPALQDYVLVSQDAVQIEHFHREAADRWSYRLLGPGDTLHVLGVTVAIDAIYAGVQLTERSTPPAAEDPPES